MTGGSSAVDDGEFPRRLVEHDRTVLATDDDVLDPRSVPAGVVDPGLDAEGHPGTQRQRVPRDDVRVLVPIETDAVPSPVEERRSVARLVDHVPCRAIDGLAGDPGADRPGPCGLGLVEGAEQVSERTIGTPLVSSPPVTHSVRVMSEP